MLYCQDYFELNCDSCYEKSYEYCNSILVFTGLPEGGIYYLNIIDKFNNRFTQQVTIDSGGNFIIDMTLLPEGYFNPFGGKFELYLSTTDEGLDFISLPITIDESWNCILLSINWTQDRDCC